MKKSESKSTKKLTEKIGREKDTSSWMSKKYGKTNRTRAEEIAAKESGARTEKSIPYGLVTKIEKNAEKAGKTIKKSDISKVSRSKAASKYKTDSNSQRKK